MPSAEYLNPVDRSKSLLSVASCAKITLVPRLLHYQYTYTLDNDGKRRKTITLTYYKIPTDKSAISTHFLHRMENDIINIEGIYSDENHGTNTRYKMTGFRFVNSPSPHFEVTVHTKGRFFSEIDVQDLYDIVYTRAVDTWMRGDITILSREDLKTVSTPLMSLEVDTEYAHHQDILDTTRLLREPSSETILELDVVIASIIPISTHQLLRPQAMDVSSQISIQLLQYFRSRLQTKCIDGKCTETRVTRGHCTHPVTNKVFKMYSIVRFHVLQEHPEYEHNLDSYMRECKKVIDSIVAKGEYKGKVVLGMMV